MKLFSIVSGIALAIAGVTAQVTSPNNDYNVTSPFPNYPYVAGRILPCTYQLFEESNSGLALTITLKSTTDANATYTVSGGADVSKTAASAVVVNNVTVYQHVYNYNIPTTVAPGSYNVVFLDTNSNSEVDIPISVLPVAATTSSPIAAAPTASGSGSVASATTTVSPFKSEGIQSIPSKAAMALVAVAALAYTL